MSSKEEILARIRQNTGTRYEKPDIAAMKRLAYPGCRVGRRRRCKCSDPQELSGCDAYCLRLAGYFLCNV